MIALPFLFIFKHQLPRNQTILSKFSVDAKLALNRAMKNKFLIHNTSVSTRINVLAENNPTDFYILMKRSWIDLCKAQFFPQYNLPTFVTKQQSSIKHYQL